MYLLVLHARREYFYDIFGKHSIQVSYFGGLKVKNKKMNKFI